MKQKAPSIVPVLILTLLTAVTWVFFSIYRALVEKPIHPVPDNISQPLTPSIDQGEVDGVKSKLFLDESQIPTSSFSVPSASTTPPSPPTPPSPSSKPKATAVASPSGTLVPKSP